MGQNENSGSVSIFILTLKKHAASRLPPTLKTIR